MEYDHFRRGEQLWLRGHPVTFVDHHRYAPHLVDAAVVRRDDERGARVVPLRNLARDRAESLVLGRLRPVP
jgi:hypothetical protein